MDYKNMDDKKLLIERITGRAYGGLVFMRRCLEVIHTKGTDAAFSRQIYILLSYNFELILKSAIILFRKEKNKDDLIKGLNYHDLEKLSKEISVNNLNSVDIKTIKKINNNFISYEIETIRGDKINIQDIIDVRYDFEKDALRDIDPEESEKIKKEIEIMEEIIKKIKDIVQK
jgi:hypothetical protein